MKLKGCYLSTNSSKGKMKSLGIRAKLIILFICIKVLPMIIIAYIAILGVEKVGTIFTNDLEKSFNANIKLIKKTANESISDSIKALDKSAQKSYEKFTVNIATNIANFLYERDNDILFLSTQKPSNKLFNEFYKSKNKGVIKSPKYIYDDASSKWIPKIQNKSIDKKIIPIKDNEKNFNYISPISINKINLPIYKEITYFDLNGIEKVKKSSINNKLLDISKKSNTYINSETYFDKIKHLKKDEIYVSDVIGKYVGTKIIGTFSKEKAKKMKIKFQPEKYGYAGLENPLGKRFEGIIRFVTPVFNNNKKVGYISLALDHRHIMEFTDSVNTVSKNLQQNISDASSGNYAFMWDKKGRLISHPRDYFISGFDPKTGKRVAPWVSADVAKKFKESKQKNLLDFLEKYPKFEKQSGQKKPNMSQLLKQGKIPLDCRYLNFAPQCTGWEKIASQGGYGSFMIYWSKVWKLSTVSVIPYYTGQYGKGKKGFGIVSIGANISDFHKVAYKTRDKINATLTQQQSVLKKQIDLSQANLKQFINSTIHNLTISTIILTIIVILIAILIANYFTKKIKELIYATNELSNGNFDIKLSMDSSDELGELTKSFKNTVSKMKLLVDEKSKINEKLEHKVKKRTEQLLKQKQKAEQMAIIDGLTGLYNRRYFDTVFQERIRINRRNKSFLCLVLIDIDHFKQYNDTYGHQEGDRALKLVAKSLQSTFNRPDDNIFRLGGEEFGLIYSVDNEEDALFIANKVKQNIENLNIEHTENSASQFVTISGGLFIINNNTDLDADIIYKKADDALYAAKHNGRNQILEA